MGRPALWLHAAAAVTTVDREQPGATIVVARRHGHPRELEELRLRWTYTCSGSAASRSSPTSGTALPLVYARRLQLGDPEGDARRAIARFPVLEIADPTPPTSATLSRSARSAGWR